MVRWGDWLLEPAQPDGHAKEAIPFVILVPLVYFRLKLAFGADEGPGADEVADWFWWTYRSGVRAGPKGGT